MPEKNEPTPDKEAIYIDLATGGLAERATLEARRVPGFDNYYATAWGVIYSYDGKRKPRALKPFLHNKGYLRVHLCDEAGRHHVYVHAAVLSAWKGQPVDPTGKAVYHVDHIDGNKANNTLANLRWLLASENSAQGDKAKVLSKGQRAVIRAAVKGGQYPRTVAEAMGVTEETIRRIVKKGVAA